MIANFGDVRAALANTPWRDDPALVAGIAAADRRGAA